MKVLYIVNARIPTEKAHGMTILKSCESFARADATVCLVVPRRRNSSKDFFEKLGVERNFRMVFLPTLDLFGIVPDTIAFRLQLFSFYLSVQCWILFQSRKWMIYSREPYVALLSFLGFRVIYECHHIFDRRPYFFWICHQADSIVTISRALKDIFVGRGFNENKIIVAPSGVDLDTFAIDIPKIDARRTLGLPMNQPIVMYTGNFTTMGEDKGITDIISALREVPDVIFIAVGGSEKDLAQYREIARERNVSDRVLLYGHAPQSILAQYQQVADILLMPFPDKPHYRNHMSPVKMFEYLASGRPIIASDLPTIREVLNVENAILIPPGNPQALAQAIYTLLSDPKRAETLAVRARADVTQYSWKNRAERILSHIRDSNKP
jgi:glycosyltransferase involved in cell wall biosynthesis